MAKRGFPFTISFCDLSLYAVHVDSDGALANGQNLRKLELKNLTFSISVLVKKGQARPQL